MKSISKTGIVQDAFGLSLTNCVASVALCLILGVDVLKQLGMFPPERVVFALLAYMLVVIVVAICLTIQSQFANGETIKESFETLKKIREGFVKACASLSAVALVVSLCLAFQELDRWSAMRPIHWGNLASSFVAFLALLAIAVAFREPTSGQSISS